MSTIESETVATPQTTPKRDWLPSQPGEPTWELALTYPRQGSWTLDEYLNLDTGRLVEFKNGVLEFLPVPSLYHQLIAIFLCNSLNEYALPRELGVAAVAPLSLSTVPDHCREPDVLLVPQDEFNPETQYPRHAIIVMEIISPGPENRRRDEVEKRAEYAEAGFEEYWLVDPEACSIRVLVLGGDGKYAEPIEFKRGQIATSKRLEGFQVSVDTVFDRFPRGGGTTVK